MKFEEIPKFNSIQPNFCYNPDKPDQKGAEILDNKEFPNSIGTSVARASVKKECHVCKDLTDFYDELFLGYVCSEECEEKFWTEYKESMTKGERDVEV